MAVPDVPSKESQSPPTTPSRGWTALRFRAWNLLLLVPLVAGVPPVFNRLESGLGGLPFFYWFQLAIIPIGVLCTIAVHLMTRDPDEDAPVPRMDLDVAVRSPKADR